MAKRMTKERKGTEELIADAERAKAGVSLLARDVWMASEIDSPERKRVMEARMALSYLIEELEARN